MPGFSEFEIELLRALERIAEALEAIDLHLRDLRDLQ